MVPFNVVKRVRVILVLVLVFWFCLSFFLLVMVVLGWFGFFFPFSWGAVGGVYVCANISFCQINSA